MGLQTTLVNDADAAALGEVWAGSASGRKTAVLISKYIRIQILKKSKHLDMQLKLKTSKRKQASIL